MSMLNQIKALRQINRGHTDREDEEHDDDTNKEDEEHDDSNKEEEEYDIANEEEEQKVINDKDEWKFLKVGKALGIDLYGNSIGREKPFVLLFEKIDLKIPTTSNFW